ncbi:MAG: hypothetical protein IJW16_01345, partial [Clostridia bacterium]|nr:hypothetical protein [Clostridia bacterium]
MSTMKKLTVLTLAEDADAIVRKLMKLRCVEIRSTEVGEGALLSAHFDSDGQKAAADSRLRRIREAIPVLNQYTMRKKRLGRSLHRVNADEFLADGRAESAWRTVEKALELCNTLKETEGEITRLQGQRESLRPWVEYDVILSERGTEQSTLILGAFPTGTLPEAVVPMLESAGAHVELVSMDKSGVYASVICHKTNEEAVQRMLAELGFLKASFREIDTTAAVADAEIEGRIAELDADRDRAQEWLHVLAEELDNVEILCDIEETNANAARHLQKLATTKKCAFLEGWIPKFARDAVVDALAEFTCAYDINYPAHDEEPPVLLRNNRFATNFEWVIGMYAYPKYGAFDPTFIMSIFYFVLFGLMFADVGYGL